MDPSAFHAVYVDHRASRDRVVRRSHEVEEHGTVGKNIQSLLLVFSSVTICTSVRSCVSALSALETSDPNPVLLLIDVPVLPHPEEDRQDVCQGSGVTGTPPEPLGLPLLRFICTEIEGTSLSSSIVPVAVITAEDGTSVIGLEERELKCIDYGALDVVQSPLSKNNVRTLQLRCYRARKTVNRTRKRSWVGIDDSQGDDYSYLREKMVHELMTEICCPKRRKVSSSGGYASPILAMNSVAHLDRIRIPKERAIVVEEAVGRWDFSAHDFSDEELVHCALIMLEHAFTMPEVAELTIPTDRLVEFLLACRVSYNDKVPYHNFRHVVDVLQAVFFFLLQLGVLPQYMHGVTEPSSGSSSSLSQIITPMDALTLLAVAVGHDVGHPGVNNAFLVTLKAPLAQLYNDKSVLESFHCAAFSQVLRAHWPKMLDQRKMIIDMILATDMGLHFDFMGKLDKLRKKFEKDGGHHMWDEKAVADYRTLLCALIIKCADISNVARKHECSARWATILIEEFSRQAHIEKDLGIPSSLVAPPITGSVDALAKSQVGFMGLFAIPLFKSLSKVLPQMQFSVRELEANKDLWSKKIATAANPNDKSKAMEKKSRTEKPLPGSYDPPAAPSESVARRNLPPVLGTALLEADLPRSGGGSVSGSESRSGIASPRSPSVRAAKQQHSSNGNATAVTVVVTHPLQVPAQTNGYGPGSEKRPKYQHSTEHLRAGNGGDEPSPNRPRSSPPDLGDCSDHHSCSKGCCGGAAVVTGGTMEKRSSRFFKKVKLWKAWRKEPSDG